MDLQAQIFVRWTGIALGPTHLFFIFTDKYIAGTYDPKNEFLRITMMILLVSSGLYSFVKKKSISDRNLLFFQCFVWLFGQCANVYFLHDHSAAIFTVCLLTIVSGFLLYFEPYKHIALIAATLTEYILILKYGLGLSLTGSETAGHIANLIGMSIGGIFVGTATWGRNQREWSFLKQLKENNRKFKEELRLAELVQRRLLPDHRTNHPGIAFDFRYLPADGVGGDMLDIIPLENERFGLMIADVSGHGVSSALISSMLKMSLYANKIDDPAKTPSDVLTALNRNMAQNLAGEFITALYANIDVRRRLLQFATAGHENPVVIRDGRLISFNARGRALGLFPEKDFDTSEFQLLKNDIVYFFTDGCFEILDDTQNILDIQKFYQLLLDGALKPFDAILTYVMDGIKQSSSDRRLIDDATMLMFKLQE